MKETDDSAQSQFETHFKGLGYEVVKFIPTNRSLTGKIKKDGGILFAKIARFEEVSRALSNEISWHRQLSLMSKHWPIYIPSIIDSGVLNDRHWFIRELAPGTATGDEDRKTLLPSFNESLEKVVDFLFILQGLKISLPNDTGGDYQFFKENGSNPKVVIESLKSHYPEVAIKSAYEWIGAGPFLKFATSHSDYKPRHIFTDGDKAYLIDAEKANNLLPLHYDVATLFTHLITIYSEYDIALLLLRNYVQKIGDPREFWSYFKALVAMIALGEINDAQKRGDLGEGHKQLIDLIENNKLRPLFQGQP